MMRKLRACCQETFTVFLLLVICESVSSKDTIYIGTKDSIIFSHLLKFVNREDKITPEVTFVIVDSFVRDNHGYRQQVVFGKCNSIVWCQ